MTWCKDTARDAAVRAAEDGRDRPLPTLGEAIARAFGFDEASAQRACEEVKSWPENVQKDCRFVLGDLLEQGVERLQALVQAGRYGKGLMTARYPGMFPKSVSASSAADHENKGDRMRPPTTKTATVENDFADAAERSSTVSKTGEGQSGMRTERVTLEIAHDSRDSPCDWDWDELLRFKTNTLADHESVRVVEETHFDDLAQVAMERDAAIREREAAKQRADRDSVKCSALADKVIRLRARVAELEAARGGGGLTPHASKMVEQPRGWLTQGESFAIINAIGPLRDSGKYACENRADLLQELLARSSPPKVVLPENPYHPSGLREGFDHAIRIVRNELVNAGVPVKEVQ